MASALQKLFRKRLSKHQQIQEQQQQNKQKGLAKKQNRVKEEESEAVEVLGKDHQVQQCVDTRPYLTVSSLNSPSSSSSHFPFSSKLSLDQFSFQSGTEGNIISIYNSTLNESSSSSTRTEIRPRSTSLSAQSMLRDPSDNGRGWSSPVYLEDELKMNQFGSLVKAEQQQQQTSGTGSEEEEDDLESNALYSRLSKGANLQADYNKAKLLLIPCKSQEIAIEDLKSDSYIALHAMEPSNLFKDQYVSVRKPDCRHKTDPDDLWCNAAVSATLETENRRVHIIVSGAPGYSKTMEQMLNVRGETTVYRKIATSESMKTLPLRTPLREKKPSSSRKDRIRIRILFVEGLILDTSPLTAPEDLSESVQTLMSSDAKQMQDQNIAEASSLHNTGDKPRLPWTLKTHSLMNYREKLTHSSALVPSKRKFSQDLAFMLRPPEELKSLEEALHLSLSILIKASREFSQAYVYVAEFDTYNSSRIRKGILSKAWQSFEFFLNDTKCRQVKLNSEDEARLILLMENVVMGYCHGKVYSSIQHIFESANNIIDTVMEAYLEKRISLENLKVELPYLCKRPALLQKAISTAASLNESEEIVGTVIREIGLEGMALLSQSYQGKIAIGGADTVSLQPVTLEQTKAGLQTPLDILEILQLTLEEVQIAIDKMRKISEEKVILGIDETIPILAYILIQAGVRDFASLLYYVRQFGISDATSSQSNWALITFEAVLEYLRKDPLQMCNGKLAALIARSRSRQQESPIARTEHEMQRSISLSTDTNRARRNSLPSSTLLATKGVNQELIKFDGSRKPKNSSSASLFELKSGICSPTMSDAESEFKPPGTPASLYNERFRSKFPFELTSVGEDGITADDSSTLPAHIYANRWTSQRTTSMFGTSDLLIRPQIIVRPHKLQPQRNHQQSWGSISSSLGRSLDQQRNGNNIKRSSEDVVRALSLGGNRISRTGSDESATVRHALSRDNHTKIANVSAKQIRRKSLDTWTTFSFFVEQASNLEELPLTPQVISESPVLSNSVGRQKANSPTLSSPSFSWLPSWSQDWGMPNREVFQDKLRGQGVHSPVTTSARSDVTDMSNIESRPTSQSSQTHGVALKEWSFPHSSSANSKLSSYHPPSPNKLYSKCLDGSDAIALSNFNATTISSTAEKKDKISSPCSKNPSSIHQRDIVRGERRKRKESRISLLSVSSFAQPLPPKVYPESATGAYFFAQDDRSFQSSSSGKSNQASDDRESMARRHCLASPKCLSTTPMHQHPYTEADVNAYQDLQPIADDSTPRSFDPSKTFPSIDIFPPPSLGRLQLPTPVDENSDPMAICSIAL